MNLKGKCPAVAVLGILLVFCFVFISGCTGEETSPVHPEEEKASEALASLKNEVSVSLAETLALAERTSDNLADTDRNQTQVNAILDNSQKSLPWVESAAFINPAGIVVAIMPDSYSGLIGKDLSYQDIVKEGLEKRSPVISDYILLEVAEKGVVLECPVFSEDGEFAGVVSLVIDPAKMIRLPAEGIKSGYGFSVMAIEPDGTILYDEDVAEIGNATFGNPVYEAYPGVIAAAEAISLQPSGTYAYTFRATGSDEEVQKEAYWDTAGILDKEWRLMVIKEF
ncbi:MAG: PDC sensor domain-containing protein [Methanomicrobiaceae archaeon]|nr:PDC sensor domain-containing protein [Methanomicrobiaceae archaeon]